MLYQNLKKNVNVWKIFRTVSCIVVSDWVGVVGWPLLVIGWMVVLPFEVENSEEGVGLQGRFLILVVYLLGLMCLSCILR